MTVGRRSDGLWDASNHRLPATPLSSAVDRGPEALRPRLATGVPLSALLRGSLAEAWPASSACIAQRSPSRSHRKPLRGAEQYIQWNGGGKACFVAIWRQCNCADNASELAGTGSDRGAPSEPTAGSNWPHTQDYGPSGQPRSATVVITKDDGGIIGT